MYNNRVQHNVGEGIRVWVYTCMRAHKCIHTLSAGTLCTHTRTQFMSKKMCPTGNISRLQVYVQRISQCFFKAVRVLEIEIKLNKGKKKKMYFICNFEIGMWLICILYTRSFFLSNFHFLLKTIYPLIFINQKMHFYRDRFPISRL